METTKLMRPVKLRRKDFKWINADNDIITLYLDDIWYRKLVWLARSSYSLHAINEQ